MKKRFFSMLLAILCVASLLPSASATITVPCMTIDSTLLLIGDSNTVSLRNYNQDLKPATVYARINGRIEECVENWSRYPAYQYNKCIFQLLNELSGDQFRTVVINMGTNNMGGSMSTFRSKYRQLLEKLFAKNPNAVIYVCLILPTNPNHCSAEGSKIFTPANVKKINDEVLGVQQEFAAQGYTARILDFNTPFRDENGYLLSKYDNGSGVHLTANGYLKMDEILETVLAKGDPDANHTWDAGSVALPPTCVDEGVFSYTCTVCGGKKNVPIPATGMHTWDSTWVSVPPTCVERGVQGFQCSACGQKQYEFIAVLGHAWKLTQTLEAEGEDPHSALGRYTCSRCAQSKDARLCAAEVFTDMPEENNWAHEPIDWAYFSGITSGKTETAFVPKAVCTRGEVVTFLWNAAGRPEPTVTQNPFSDVSERNYFYMPVLWALEQGITAGKTETTFCPKAACSRAEVLCFLWNAAGKPAPPVSDCPFSDVPSGKYYYQPVLWASGAGITGGTSPTTFSPKNPCTRAQVITFLYKATVCQPEPEPEPEPEQPQPEPEPEPEQPQPEPEPQP